MAARIVSLIVGLALLVGLSADPVGATATIEINATASPSEFRVEIAGFKDNEEVSTWLTGPHQQVMATDAHVVNDRGRHTIRLFLARHLEAGRWALTVHGLESDREAIGYFELAQRQSDASASVRPSPARPGDTIVIVGSGFRKAETISFWLTDPAGASQPGGMGLSDNQGVVTLTLRLPESASIGRWAITLYGLVSDRLAIVALPVEPRASGG